MLIDSSTDRFKKKEAGKKSKKKKKKEKKKKGKKIKKKKKKRKKKGRQKFYNCSNCLKEGQNLDVKLKIPPNSKKKFCVHLFNSLKCKSIIKVIIESAETFKMNRKREYLYFGRTVLHYEVQILKN